MQTTDDIDYITVLKSEFELINDNGEQPSTKQQLEQSFSNWDDQQQEYEIMKPLGRGAHSFVYLVRQRTLEQYQAMKVYQKQSLNYQKVHKQIPNEIAIHQQLEHPNIAAMVGQMEDKDNLYIFIEYCEQGDLLSFLESNKQQLDYQQIYQIIMQIGQAVQYLHCQNIIHRDLKLQNIMMSNGKPKIIDFGLSVKLKFKGELRNSKCGTPRTMAPEIVRNEYYDNKVDCYALGVVIQQMMDYLEQNLVVKQFDTPSFNKSGLKEQIRQLQIMLSQEDQNNRIDIKQFILRLENREQMDIEKQMVKQTKTNKYIRNGYINNDSENQKMQGKKYQNMGSTQDQTQVKVTQLRRNQSIETKRSQINRHTRHQTCSNIQQYIIGDDVSSIHNISQNKNKAEQLNMTQTQQDINRILINLENQQERFYLDTSHFKQSYQFRIKNGTLKLDCQKIVMQVGNRKFVIDQKQRDDIEIVCEEKSRKVEIKELPQKYRKYMVYIQNVIRTLNKNIPIVTIINKHGLFQIMSDQTSYQGFFENINLQVESQIDLGCFSSKAINREHWKQSWSDSEMQDCIRIAKKMVPILQLALQIQNQN